MILKNHFLTNSLLLILFIFIINFTARSQEKNGFMFLKENDTFFKNTELYKIKHNFESFSPLFLLNGKGISKNKLNLLSPKSIKSIVIIKGEKAVKKYGEKGKFGVIEIISNKKLK